MNTIRKKKYEFQYAINKDIFKIRPSYLKDQRYPHATIRSSEAINVGNNNTLKVSLQKLN